MKDSAIPLAPLRYLAGHNNTHLKVTMDEYLPRQVKGDPDRLRQIILNLGAMGWSSPKMDRYTLPSPAGKPQETITPWSWWWKTPASAWRKKPWRICSSHSIRRMTDLCPKQRALAPCRIVALKIKHKLLPTKYYHWLAVPLWKLWGLWINGKIRLFRQRWYAPHLTELFLTMNGFHQLFFKI